MACQKVTVTGPLPFSASAPGAEEFELAEPPEPLLQAAVSSSASAAVPARYLGFIECLSSMGCAETSQRTAPAVRPRIRNRWPKATKAAVGSNARVTPARISPGL